MRPAQARRAGTIRARSAERSGQRPFLQARASMTTGAASCISGCVMTADVAADLSAEVLLVEDDHELRAEMSAYLTSNGHRVHEASDVQGARRILQSRPIQIVVLDVNLPGEDGFSLCRALASSGGPAILMLSAQGDAIDRVLGLELGADDYVVKPITPRELLARVKALMRRRPGDSLGKKRNSYRFGGFHLDLAARQLLAPTGAVLLLTRTELAILTALLDRAQAVVPREDLAPLLKVEDPAEIGRAVDLHISRLRRKIQDQTDHELIRTYRGVGYMLDAKVLPE